MDQNNQETITGPLSHPFTPSHQSFVHLVCPAPPRSFVRSLTQYRVHGKVEDLMPQYQADLDHSVPSLAILGRATENERRFVTTLFAFDAYRSFIAGIRAPWQIWRARARTFPRLFCGSLFNPIPLRSKIERSRKKSHPIILFPTSTEVSKVSSAREQANEQTSEQTSK